MNESSTDRAANPTKAIGFGPATVANLGCGFDVFGLALCGLGDTVEASILTKDSPRITLTVSSLEHHPVPADPTKNTAGFAASLLLEALSYTGGIKLHLRKGLPIGSGLGSSSASAIAALVAVNALLGSQLSKKELLPFVIQAEGLASGSPHADNVAPSLLGGITLVRSTDPPLVEVLPVPDFLHAVVVTPQIILRTLDARRILVKEVSLSNATLQVAHAATFILSLFRNDREMMKSAVQDNLVEPQRSLLIPGYHDVKQAALEHGALGTGISGSGPSLFALSDSASQGEVIAERMKHAFAQHQIQASSHVSPINTIGAHLL